MTSAAHTPSQGDMKLFYSVLKNCRSKPDVDWSLVAADCGFKNAEVAKTRYGQVRRKVEGNLGGPATSSPAAKATPGKAASGVKKNTGRVGAKGSKTPKKMAQQLEGQYSDDVDFHFETPSKVKNEDLVKMEESKEWAQDIDAFDLGSGRRSLFG